MAARRARPPRALPRSESAEAARTLSATVETHEQTTVIRLSGSVRCATAPVLREALDAVLAERPVTVVLDLAEVTADDELGLWVFPAMAGYAARRGIEMIVAAPGRALRVRLRRLGGHHLEVTDVPCPTLRAPDRSSQDRRPQHGCRPQSEGSPPAPQPSSGAGDDVVEPPRWRR